MELNLEVVVPYDDEVYYSEHAMSDHPNVTRQGEFLGVKEAEAHEAEQDEYWAARLREEWEDRSQPDWVPSDGEVDSILKSGPCTIISADGTSVVLNPVTRKPRRQDDPIPYCLIPERCEAIIRGCKSVISQEIQKIHAICP